MEARGVSEKEKEEEEMGVPPSFPPPTAAYPEKEGRRGGVTFRSSSLFLSAFFFGGRDLLSLFRWVGKGGEPASSPFVGGSFVRIGCLSEDADGWGRIWDGKRRAWGMGSREEKSPYEVPREWRPSFSSLLATWPLLPFFGPRIDKRERRKRKQ